MAGWKHNDISMIEKGREEAAAKEERLVLNTSTGKIYRDGAVLNEVRIFLDLSRFRARRLSSCRVACVCKAAVENGRRLAALQDC